MGNPPIPAAGAEAYDRYTSLERLGKYEILRLLAVGGMAEIYLARETGIEGFERLVVVKQILKQFEADAEFVTMLLDEARLAATLQHPNVVQVLDIGAANGRHFFAMEYLHGHDLAKLLSRAAAARRRLLVDHAIAIVCGAAAGLHYAHERRGLDGKPLDIVHRDVSPGNIVVTFDGGIKVVDFGIAKAAARRSKTFEGMVKGKVSYMSPEQCAGKPLDRRSDLFSLGIVLWELTTGKKLFRGTSEYLIANQLLNEEIPPPSSRVDDYPPALERIVMRALSRDPDERQESLQAFQLELEDFARDQRIGLSSIGLSRFMRELFGDDDAAWAELQPTVVAGKPVEPVPSAKRPSSRRLRAWSLAAGAVVVAGALALIASGRTRGEPAAAPRPAATRPAVVPAAAAQPAAAIDRPVASERETAAVPAAEPVVAPPIADAEADAGATGSTEPPPRRKRRGKRRLRPDLERLREQLTGGGEATGDRSGDAPD